MALHILRSLPPFTKSHLAGLSPTHMKQHNRHLGPRMPAALAGGRWLSRTRRGQALVEFAAVLLPLLLVVVGIIQFGLIFAANVTLTNAAREGARAGTIYVYDTTQPNGQNGRDRCTDILAAATNEAGLLDASGFGASSPCPTGYDLTGDGAHDLWQNGDLIVSICSNTVATDDDCPDPADSATYCTQQAGTSCLVRVELTYNAPIIVPLLDAALGSKGSTFQLTATATMVIN